MSKYALMMGSLITLLACTGDKDDGPLDTSDGSSGPGFSTAEGVCGTVVLEDDWCDYPSTVGIYTVLEGSTACDTTGMFDTGGVPWDDWRDEEVAAPTVRSDGSFEADLDPGDYAAYSWDDCGGCATFTVEDSACAEVTLELEEIIYADAPNVYLYPETPTRIGVRVGGASHITAAIPEYPRGGWTTWADPDGQLFTSGEVFDYLFYEMSIPTDLLQSSEGWCVEGAHAQQSIELAMDTMGFLPNEIDDFSEFWDPEFPSSAEFTVYPQLQGLPALAISPRPEHLLRAWFVVEPGCQPVIEPELPRIPRTGYHASEWGVVLDASFDRPWAEVL